MLESYLASGRVVSEAGLAHLRATAITQAKALWQDTLWLATRHERLGASRLRRRVFTLRCAALGMCISWDADRAELAGLSGASRACSILESGRDVGRLISRRRV